MFIDHKRTFFDTETFYFKFLCLQTLPKESKDALASGLYSKLSLPTSGLENETATPTLDVASQYLKPATGGAEISYHDNLEVANHKIDKKDKLSIN